MHTSSALSRPDGSNPPNFQNVTFNNIQNGSCFDFTNYSIPTFTGFDTFSPIQKGTTDVYKPNPPKDFTYNNEKDKYAKHNAEKMKKLTPEMQERTKKLIAYANLQKRKDKIAAAIVSGSLIFILL